MKIAPLFPTPVAIIEVDKKFSTIGKELQKVALKKEETNVIGDVTGEAILKEGLDAWGHISESNYVLDQENFADFQNYVLDCCETFIRDVLCYNPVELFMTQSWVSVKKPGQKHTQHTHANSLISGVFYWHEDITPIIFSKTTTGTKQLDPGYNFEMLDNIPEARPVREISVPKNHLILFESTLMHEVPQNKNNKPRYSLSFNTFPKSIGHEDTLTKLKVSRVK